MSRYPKLHPVSDLQILQEKCKQGGLQTMSKGRIAEFLT